MLDSLQETHARQRLVSRGRLPGFHWPCLFRDMKNNRLLNN